MRVGIITGVVIVFAANVAQAKMAEFTQAAVGCPSEDGLLAVYQAAGSDQDFKTVNAIVEHYDCEWIDKGVKLTLIRQDVAVTIVVRPHPFSKDTWYYVPTNSVTVVP